MITMGEVPKQVAKPQKPQKYVNPERTREEKEQVRMDYGKKLLLVGMLS